MVLAERSHYDLTLYGLAVRNVAKWSAPLVARTEPSEADILAMAEPVQPLTRLLSAIVAGDGAEVDVGEGHRAIADRALGESGARERVCVDEIAGLLEAEEPAARLVEVTIRAGAYGDQFGLVADGLTFSRLREVTHGLDLGALPALLSTRSGKIELMSTLTEEELARVVERLSAARMDELLFDQEARPAVERRVDAQRAAAESRGRSVHVARACGRCVATRRGGWGDGGRGVVHG